MQRVTLWNIGIFAGCLFAPPSCVAEEAAYRVSIVSALALNHHPTVLQTQETSIASNDPEWLPLPVSPDRIRHPVSSQVWMDIRPRSLESAHPGRITTDELPVDESGLSVMPDSPQRVQLYRVNLQLGDVCAGARFHHRLLYFEDRKLERRGVTAGVLGHVPAVRSGLHFVGSAAILPLRMLKDPPHECVTSGCVCR